ncbi:hypothetical protein SCLCIDRAFT_910003 [Scleroderma citrinum Foug A]|uniref:Uncharacterized protein n=1 Tax=Scleroderma citrinum Foug A TaxID=1036808 RepID=A0A0C3DKK7_9AGAM|nr:hypothetical protein SCLCIDRAFT_910003 [Scleroderma citrinum Foug A]
MAHVSAFDSSINHMSDKMSLKGCSDSVGQYRRGTPRLISKRTILFRCKTIWPTRTIRCGYRAPDKVCILKNIVCKSREAKTTH